MDFRDPTVFEVEKAFLGAALWLGQDPGGAAGGI